MKHTIVPRLTAALAVLLTLSVHFEVAAQAPADTFAGLPNPAPAPDQSLRTDTTDWHKDAVIYHIWVAAFRDTDDNGIGDLKGITQSLDTLKDLGVNTLWLSPFFESASMVSNLHGYDVTDHYKVDPRLGTNADADELIRQAHERSIRLIFDFVPNHLSDRHPWFIESSRPDSPRRDWFVWRDQRPQQGWTGFDDRSDWYERNGDYYYGIFWSGMPDVNHNNAEVRMELAKAARHWLDRGFDGIRMDAVRYLYENLDGDGAKADQEDQPESVSWFEAWRRDVMDPYTELGYAKFMVAENWTGERESLKTYLENDGRPVFHMTLNFPMLPALTELDVDSARESMLWDASLKDSAWLGNFVSNHDMAADRPGTLFADQPNKLRAQTAWLLLGPGTPFVYYGNEIAQPQGPQSGDTRHRQPLDWDEVSKQQQDPESHWRWHQQLIQTRNSHASIRRGKATLLTTNQDADKVLAVWRESDSDATLTIFSGSSDGIENLKITLDKSSSGKRFQSLLDGRSLTAQDTELVVGKLAPYESKVLVQAKPQPLRPAHAHNDYHQQRPLEDALDNGFCSVEADIFLVDGQLLVGHDLSELRSSRTLQSLYLDPLRRRVKQNGGRVYPGGPPVTLLIDIKANGAQAYAALDAVLATYPEMISGVADGAYHQRAVDVVISGDRAKKEIAADATRFAGIDGRLADLDSDAPAHLMPLISDRWTSHFRWRGEGDMPPEERKKLRDIVRQAHRAGRRVRFWATPESPAIWRELLDAKVDHINTDRLVELSAFLQSR